MDMLQRVHTVYEEHIRQPAITEEHSTGVKFESRKYPSAALQIELLLSN